MSSKQDHPCQAAKRDVCEQLMQAELNVFLNTLEQSWQHSALPTHVRKALTCIHANLFNEELSVAFVRAQCSLHNHNISCQFRRFVGTGMRRYIEEQRLSAVERLLEHDTFHILDIAWAVGYRHPESFDRAFKRCKAISPQQFRQSMRR